MPINLTHTPSPTRQHKPNTQDILRRCMEEEVTASLPACFASVPLTVKMAVGKTLGEMRTIPLR